MKKSLYKKLTCIILACLLLFSPIVYQVFAAGSNAENQVEETTKAPVKTGDNETTAGAVTGTETSDGSTEVIKNDPNIQGHWRRAYLIRLELVPNTAGSVTSIATVDDAADGDDSDTADDEISECLISASNKYYETYPTCFINSLNIVKECGLIQIQGEADISNSSASLSPQYATSHNTKSIPAFGDAGCGINYQIDEERGLTSAEIEAWKPVVVVSDKISANSQITNDFLQGKVPYSWVKSQINGSALPSAVDNIARCFITPETLQKTIGGEWTKVSDLSYKLGLLDILVTINYMCNNTYDYLIEDYLKYLNANGSPNFVVPVAACAAVWQGVGSSEVLVSSLPDYYGAVAGVGAYNFTQIDIVGKDNLKDTEDAYKYWREQFEALMPTHVSVFRSNTPYSFRGLWWNSGINTEVIEPKRVALSLIPTHYTGATAGYIGYTYLALGGGDGVAPPIGDTQPDDTPPPDTSPSDTPGGEDVSLPFIIDCVPHPQTEPNGTLDTIEVAKGTTNCFGAVHFALFDPDKKYTQLEKQFKNAEGGIATLHLEFSREGDNNARGLVVTNPVLSENSPLEGCSISRSGNVVKVEGITYDMIKALATRPIPTLAFIDQTFTLNKNSTNTYWCKGWFEFKLRGTDGTYSHIQKSNLVPKGVLINNNEAGDDIYWRMKDDPGIHYRSELTGMDSTTEIVGNFAEIKSGTPDTGEEFEAMSGIPTDQPVSVRFGVNEFMQNLEGEIKVNPECYRISEYKWTFKHSYATTASGVTAKCKITCGGHTSGVPMACI